MRILISLVLSLCLLSCNQKKNLSTQENAKDNLISNNIEASSTHTAMSYNNDCYKDRAVTREYIDQEVKVEKIMNMYMFSFENSRWQPCEVPEEFHHEGMMLKVSGQVLEIKPNERRAGSPFNITSIIKM